MNMWAMREITVECDGRHTAGPPLIVTSYSSRETNLTRPVALASAHLRNGTQPDSYADRSAPKYSWMEVPKPGSLYFKMLA